MKLTPAIPCIGKDICGCSREMGLQSALHAWYMEFQLGYVCSLYRPFSEVLVAVEFEAESLCAKQKEKQHQSKRQL